MNIEKFKQSIKSSKVISFDLFDTLFYRPYLNPDDLFSHLEIIYSRPFFKNKRLIAEKNLRLLSKDEEITYDEIYEHIHEEFMDMKSKELKLEYNSIMINSEIQNLFYYAKSLNKKIIFISDMYLPTDFIKKLLEKFEINGYHLLYISSEFKKTKHKGSLFKKVIDDLNCSPSEILHVGDNKKSDYKIPKKIGLKTFYYPSFNDQFKSSSRFNKLYFEFYEKSESDFLQRLFFKQKINTWCTGNKITSHEHYWENIGYYFGSLIALSYYKIINKNFIPHEDELLFVGRDGHALKLFFDKLKPEWKSHYINLPRIIAKKSTVPFDLEEVDNIHFLYDALENNSGTKCFEEKKKEVIANLNKLEIQFKNRKKFYSNYLRKNNVNINKRLIIVDSATHNFTAQSFLSSLSKNKVLGIYFYVRKVTYQDFDYESVYDLGFNKLVPEMEGTFIQFIEYILSSPENLAIDIDKENFDLIYRKDDSEHYNRKNKKLLIDNGIKNGATFIKSIILDEIYKVNTGFLMKRINLFINTLINDEINYFKKIKITYDCNHVDYVPIFSSDDSFLNILFSSKNKGKKLRRMNHFTKYQNLAMMIRFPILLKTSFKKKVLKIYIFPYLNSKVVSINLKLFGRVTLNLYIGKY
ncbi:MAG: HAD-IA family hydrolase [Pontiellaceae bacterium]